MFNFKTASLVVCLAGAAVLADSATTKPMVMGKLVQPWSKLTTLSDDQKSKIIELHDQANKDRKVIDEKEKSDIMALLSDDQKAELKKAGKSETKSKKAEPADDTAK